jgi:hypothetical protein
MTNLKKLILEEIGIDNVERLIKSVVKLYWFFTLNR